MQDKKGEIKMTLGEAQEQFSLMLGKLIIFAYNKGYKIRMGDVWARDGHKVNSNHYIKLAADLNLFKGKKYLTDGTGHDELHDYWDSLGGGRRITNDLNHYSLEWNGRL